MKTAKYKEEHLDGRFILPIFTRWLKENNIYWIFASSTYKYPIPEFPLDKWLNLVNGVNATTQDDLFAKHVKLIVESPFAWKYETQPKTYNIITHGGNCEWDNIDSEWRRYMMNLKKTTKLYG